MPRYKLTIEYDGGPFQGWQWQDHGPSVQGCLQRAATALNGAPVEVMGAGRTDSGVHALRQVAHIDLDKEFRTDTVRDAINQHLRPDPIAVLKAELCLSHHRPATAADPGQGQGLARALSDRCRGHAPCRAAPCRPA